MVRKEELYHYGVKGMKWGVRRYQNADGTLTAAGKKREAKLEQREQKRKVKAQNRWEQDVRDNWHHAYNRSSDTINKKIDGFNKEWDGRVPKKSDGSWDLNSKEYKAYIESYCNMWNDIYTKELDSTFGKQIIDNGRQWCEMVPQFMNAEDFT